LFSLASHAVTEDPLKRTLRVLDQACIYLLIVGSYTPFAVAYLRVPGWTAFLVVTWTLALVGFFAKVVWSHRVDRVAIWTYVALGWVLGIAVPPLLGVVPTVCLMWMAIGGVCYTGGTYFLVNDHRRPYFHAVWHVFVIAGSAWHFFAILFAVAMPS
jgi:hemolysin III